MFGLRTIFYFSNSSKLLQSKALLKFGITNQNIYRNLSTSQLYELGLSQNVAGDQVKLSSTGALVAYSGKRTGRTPNDKRVVQDEVTSKNVWWGKVNIPITPESNSILEQVAINYLNTQPRLFVVDGYAGWDPASRLKIRIVCSRVYHAQFMRNMLIVPTQEELDRDFSGDVDFHVFNAGQLHAPQIPGVTPGSETCVSVNLTQKKMVILGSQYAGEMKKGVFGVTHYEFPRRGILTLHSSANEGKNGDVTLLFGLSGTGKTTLSADPSRSLIGDDEHCWSDQGIFNIEGGCYAKCVDLTREKEPEIFDAIKYGAVLENIIFENQDTRVVDYKDISITENTRVSYPLEFIPGAKFPAMGGHPKNIFFLTCDAYGVLPPVSSLTPAQAMYHFISGYTAKVAGTEVGIKEPQATFSACFGEAFLPLHPTLYAEMLAKKIQQHGTRVWLINTGWSGGKYGVGKRMSLKYTRAIIDAIHNGSLENAQYDNFPVFNLRVPKSVEGVPSEILNPKNTWSDKAGFDETLKVLGDKFLKNFVKYSDKASEEILGAGPKL